MTWFGALLSQKRAEHPSPAIFPSLDAKSRTQASPVVTDDSFDQSAPVPWDWPELTRTKPLIDTQRIRRELGYIHTGTARQDDSTPVEQSEVIPLAPSRRYVRARPR